MPPEIVVVSDPVCPWCLLGLHRLDRAIARLGPDKGLKLSYWPFLLDPATPREGVDVRALLTRKYGRAPDEMWDRLEAEAKKSELDLDMRAPTVRYPSQPALAVIGLAREHGSDYALGRAIGRAYYLEGQNIADPDTLTNIAEPFGLDREMVRSVAADQAAWTAVEAMAAELANQGVSGVPLFLFDQRFKLSGAHAEEVFDRALEELAGGAV